VGVRALTVWFDADEWGLMEEDDGSQRIANLATRDRVWLDERTDAFHWRRGVEPDRPAALVSVFDGTRAAARYGSGSGPQLIRYEGSPEVVARLAGWISIDVARAHVAGAPIPRGIRVDEPDVAPPDNVFELPVRRVGWAHIGVDDDRGHSLALAGVGTHGLVVETERHTVVVTGAAVGADAAAEIAPYLRLA
jgi:hypothetical protein